MSYPVSYYASMHYSVYLMLQKAIILLKEDLPKYSTTNINIINLDHVEGLPDAQEPYCFLGYSLTHSLCKKEGRLYEGSEGVLQFTVGSPIPENDQMYFSEFHIQFFYDILERFSNLFCMPSININGIVLDNSLLRFQTIDQIMTSSDKGFIVTECLFEVIFSPE